MYFSSVNKGKVDMGPIFWAPTSHRIILRNAKDKCLILEYMK